MTGVKDTISESNAMEYVENRAIGLARDVYVHISWEYVLVRLYLLSSRFECWYIP